MVGSYKCLFNPDNVNTIDLFRKTEHRTRVHVPMERLVGDQNLGERDDHTNVFDSPVHETDF